MLPAWGASTIPVLYLYQGDGTLFSREQTVTGRILRSSEEVCCRAENRSHIGQRIPL